MTSVQPKISADFFRSKRLDISLRTMLPVIYGTTVHPKICADFFLLISWVAAMTYFPVLGPVLYVRMHNL